MREYSLPWPPCCNSATGRRYVGSKERKFREAVLGEVLACGYGPALFGRVACVLVISAPTRARRDLDNVAKTVLDALVAAGTLEDDSQIDDLRVLRGPSRGRPGSVRAILWELTADWADELQRFARVG